MKTSKILVMGLVVGSLTLAQGLFAKGQNMNMPSFESFDLNKDGKISEDELMKARENKMVQNANDGKLLKNASNAKEFPVLDTNKDGFIDKDEFAKHQTAELSSKNNQKGQGMNKQGGQGQGKGMNKGRQGGGQGKGQGQNRQ